MYVQNYFGCKRVTIKNNLNAVGSVQLQNCTWRPIDINAWNAASYIICYGLIKATIRCCAPTGFDRLHLRFQQLRNVTTDSKLFCFHAERCINI